MAYIDSTSRIWLTYRFQFPLPIKDGRLADLSDHTPSNTEHAQGISTATSPTIETLEFGRGWEDLDDSFRVARPRRAKQARLDLGPLPNCGEILNKIKSTWPRQEEPYDIDLGQHSRVLGYIYLRTEFINRSNEKKKNTIDEPCISHFLFFMLFILAHGDARVTNNFYMKTTELWAFFVKERNEKEKKKKT